MPRITPVEAPAGAAERPYAVIGRIRAHRPEVSAAWSGVFAALRTSGTLPPRLHELVRLRIAFHNQCRPCMSARYEPDEVSEDLVCSLERPSEAPDLTDAERAALRYADLFATNHLAIGDEMYAELRRWFDDGEIVELGMVCGYYVGSGRLTATWGIDTGLPESFQAAEGERLTPWGHDDAIVMPRG